jgi:hypothetical protein
MRDFKFSRRLIILHGSTSQKTILNIIWNAMIIREYRLVWDTDYSEPIWKSCQASFTVCTHTKFYLDSSNFFVSERHIVRREGMISVNESNWNSATRSWSRYVPLASLVGWHQHSSTSLGRWKWEKTVSCWSCWQRLYSWKSSHYRMALPDGSFYSPEWLCQVTTFTNCTV